MIPFIWLTHGVQSAIVANVFFLAVSTIITFFLLPRIFRPLSVLVMIGLPILFGYTMSGMNDLLLLPFLVVVAHKWNEVGDGSVFRRRDAVAGGGARVRALRQAARLVHRAVPDPRHLADLHPSERNPHRHPDHRALHGDRDHDRRPSQCPVHDLGLRAHGSAVCSRRSDSTQCRTDRGSSTSPCSSVSAAGTSAAYTIAAAFLLVAALVAQSRFFPALGRAALVTPGLILFFPARSLAAYFMTLLPVWIVSLVTCRNSNFALARLRGSGVRHLLSAVLAVSLIAATAFLGVAAATPAPLALQIESVQTNGQLQGVWQIHVSVHNRSSRAITPHFATNSFGQVTTFWHVIRGPKTLGPQSTAEYVLDAPNLGSMPGITTPFLLQAVTDHPATISSARLYTPQPYSAYLVPDYVNRIVKVGRSVRFAVQLRSPYGAAVHKQGVRIALGQLIYGQTDLIPAEARINRGNIGESPVYARTNRDGIARFIVRSSTRANGNAIYFQSWIAPPERISLRILRDRGRPLA